MADLAETETYVAGIYQLEITDPVIGGPDGIDNLQAKQLANRTNWLKAKIDSILSMSFIHTAVEENPGGTDEFGYWDSFTQTMRRVSLTNFIVVLRTYFDTVYAVLNSPAFTGTPTAPTASAGTNTTQIANTDFVMSKSGAMSALRLLHIQDQKPNGTSGGDSVAGVNTRVLNTVITNTISGASLSSNAITLPAGTYIVEAMAVTYAVNSNRLILRNNTAGLELDSGLNSENRNTDNQTNISALKSSPFVLVSTSALLLQHWAETARATDGLGWPVSSGGVEIYADIKIWKVA